MMNSPVLVVILTPDASTFPAPSARQNYLIHWQRPRGHGLHDKIALAEIYHQPEKRDKKNEN